MHNGSMSQSYTMSGDGVAGRRTEGYSSGVRWFKEPGVFNGKLEVEASCDGKGVLAGPSHGKLIVAGDKALLIIKGGGEFTLQNIEVDGDLIIHLPSGGVTLLDSVKVAGTTLVIAGDPMAATGVEGLEVNNSGQSFLSFRSCAKHSEEIILLQSQLLHVHLEGDASSLEVAVHLSGPLSLSGGYGNVLVSPTASRLRLRLEEGTVIGGALKLMAPGICLNAQGGSIFDLWNDPHYPLSGEAASLAEDVSARLADINGSRNAEEMGLALAGAGIFAKSAEEIELLLNRIQMDSCSSLTEVKECLQMCRMTKPRVLSPSGVL